MLNLFIVKSMKSNSTLIVLYTVQMSNWFKVCSTLVYSLCLRLLIVFNSMPWQLYTIIDVLDTSYIHYNLLSLTTDVSVVLSLFWHCAFTFFLLRRVRQCVKRRWKRMQRQSRTHSRPFSVIRADGAAASVWIKCQMSICWSIQCVPCIHEHTHPTS